jgi:tetratricopeptide (TPR) repeat protein
LLQDALAIQRELGNTRGIANTLNNLGIIASDENDYSLGRALHEECLAIQRDLGDRRGIAVSLNNVAAMAHEQSEYPSARALHEQSLAIFRELGDRRGIADSLNNLGNVAREQGDFRSARAFQRESLEIYRDLGDRRGIATSLEALSDIEIALCRPNRAASIWGAAQRLREQIGSPLRPGERTRYENQVAAARASLADATAFDRAWQEGRAMALQQTIEYALGAE